MKKEQRRRKIKSRGTKSSHWDYNTRTCSLSLSLFDTVKRIQRKQERDPGVQVYRSAFYSAELHGGGSLYGPGLFCSSLLYLSNNIPCGYTNPHLQIQNAVHHNRRTTKAYLHTPTKRGKMVAATLSIEAQRIIHTSTNIDELAAARINKRLICLYRARLR